MIKNRDVWVLSIIVLSSYCGYKNIDNYSIYFVDILKLKLSQSTFYTSFIFWIRLIGALLAGITADWLYRKFPYSRFLFLTSILTLASVSQAILAFASVSGVLEFLLVIWLTITLAREVFDMFLVSRL